MYTPPTDSNDEESHVQESHVQSPEISVMKTASWSDLKNLDF